MSIIGAIIILNSKKNKKQELDLPDKDDLQLDDNGILRSKPLPRVPGTRVELPDQVSFPEKLELWKRMVKDPNQLIVLDLFSGAGGFSYGFQKAGFFIAAGVDRDDSSVLSHGYNFLSKSICKDITEIEDPKKFLDELEIPRVDVVIGGPPCQGFSQVGKAAIKKLGLESYYHNILNNLYKEFVRFVEILQPQAFLMENVPAMASFKNGELVDRIKEKFTSLGYRVDDRVLNSKYYGVPQARKRLFIGGNSLNAQFPWPAPVLSDDDLVTVRDAIGDLPFRYPPARDDEALYENKPESDYQKLMREHVQDNILYDHVIRDVRDDDKIIFSLMDEGDNYTDIPEEFRRYRSDSFKDKYSKLIWNEPSWTVTAHIRKDSYRYIHPDKEQGRMLSIREFARLQSFPDHFRFCGAPTRRMQQIGNAVPPILAEKIAIGLYDLLQSNQS